MTAFIKRMWAAAPWATAILAIALAASGVFGWRMVTHWVYWNDPARHDQIIAPWMTPRYVALSWKIPREVVIEALTLERGEGPPPSLARLAAERGVPVEELITALEEAIAEFRRTQPAPEAGR
jgi:hypothetical protein